MKVIAHDAMRAVIDPLRKSESIRRVLRGLIYGRKANYYLEGRAKKGGCKILALASHARRHSGERRSPINVN